MTHASNAGLSKPASSEWTSAALVIAACLAPSVIWILGDGRVWWWDQALYGEATLRVWQALLSGMWADTVIHAMGGEQPLTVWLGQFFVPLRHATGRFESALLFVNICAAGGVLILIYDIARRLGAGAMSNFAGVMACGGSGIFIGLTHQYFVEIVQCLAAAAAMAVALDAEKRSRARTAAMFVGVIAFGFLSKVSSVTFLLPMLCYAALAMWLTRRKIRPAVQWSDAAWLAGAACIAGLAAAWYVIHWPFVVRHFIDATTADITLHWGSPVNLPVKLRYWIGEFGRSLSPSMEAAVGTGILVSAALILATAQLLARKPTEWAEASVANGTLFIFAVAGTVVVVIFTFSLQINEDVRFILPLMPMTAVLVAWGLATVGIRIVAYGVSGMLALNAAVNHAFSFGSHPLGLAPAAHLLPIEWGEADAAPLTAAVRATCHAADAGKPHLVAVSYATLNVNTVNFYAAKESYATGFRCFYTTYDALDPDAGRALEAIDAIAPAYVVTVAPEMQPAPDLLHPDFVNRASRPVAEHLASDPRYRLESSPGSFIQIYHRVEEPDQ